MVGEQVCVPVFHLEHRVIECITGTQASGVMSPALHINTPLKVIHSGANTIVKEQK